MALVVIDGLEPSMVVADRGYDSKTIRDSLVRLGVTPVIPSRRNAKVQHPLDHEAYASRSMVERVFCQIKDYMRISIRKDKIICIFMSFTHLAAALMNDRIARNFALRP